ncbi:MAG: TonB-dependent receptor [Hyphomonadaceae bacterium]
MRTVRAGEFGGMGISLTKVSGLAIAAALGCVVLAPAALAQQADEKDVVVVTGTATGTEYEKVGNSLTVVTSEQIEEGGYTYVPDVLRQVPGLAINRSGPVGGLTQVRTRGAEGNHTVVMFNGVDVSDAGNGETDLSTLLTGNVDRIEVLRGPQSGLYGSNALAGVINIITRRNVNGSFVNASGEIGTDKTATVTGGYGIGDGKSFVDLGLAGTTSDGYDVSALGAINGPPGVTGDKEGYDNITGYVSGGAEVSPIFRVDGFARYVKSNAQLDGQDFSGIPGLQGQTFDDASETETKSYNLAGSGTLTLMDGAWVTIGSASYTNSHVEGGDGTAFGDYGDKAWRRKFGLQSSYKFGAPDFVSTLTGFAESKKEYYRNTHPFDPSQVGQDREMIGIGAQYQAAIASQFYLSATVRHDDNDGDFEDADTYGVAASWVIPNTGTRPHASIGTGVTNPSFFEQFGFIPGTYIGNPNLKPEESTGWDIGVEQTWIEGRLVTDVTYFKAKLKNEIGGFSTPTNATSKSDREGVEVYVRYNPTDDIDLIGSYTYLDATEPAGIEVRRPENQASFDGTWHVGGGPLQLNLGVTYNGEQRDTDFATFLRTQMDAYTLVRVGAAYTLSDQIELYARVENALDEDYQEVIGYRGSPQGVFVGIRFKDGPAKK